MDNNTNLLIEKIKEKLKEVKDPEIGYDLVSLGLVYDIQISEENKKLDIKLGLTSPFCPLAGFILADAYRAVSEIDQILNERWDVNIEYDFNIPWSIERMSPELKEQLSSNLPELSKKDSNQ
ncbi:MAG: metal-sulfur cluster assembly factor [Candidatus Woesearchaeota archaeon]